MNRYNHLNKYLKSKFGERTLKVCVDGGFTCPNRDGNKSTGGCIFCSGLGAGELIKYRTNQIMDSIKNQVSGFLNSYRGERANKFIVYFQSFTNTYDSLENLKLKYDTALSVSEKIIGLQVATRPDCITEDIVKLLSSYQDKYYVCVELGFQTANDKIGEFINRGYTTDEFISAVNLLHQYNIPVVGHMMIGLPNETIEDVNDTLALINKVGCEGIKIHSTYVVENTELCELYSQGKYTPISMDYYVSIVGFIISNLNKDTIIHRINADPPKSIFVSPDWTLRKKVVINAINKYLEDNDIFQGDKKIKITQL